MVGGRTLQANNAVAGRQHCRIVADDDGCARGLACSNRVDHALGVRAVEGGGGLVGKQERRLRQQGPSYADTLALPAGELVGAGPFAVVQAAARVRGAEEIRQIQQVEDLGDSRIVGVAARGASQDGRNRHGWVEGKLRFLRDPAHAAGVRTINSSAHRSVQARDGAQQGCLSAARRSRDPHDRTAVDAEVELGENIVRAVGQR